MSFEYVDFEEARNRDGLRMIVEPGIPSPWGEAAKGIFHHKGLPFVAVPMNPGNPELLAWAGGHASAPVVFYDDEAPRWDWHAILLLAERLAPDKPLLPEGASDRAMVFGYSHEICGEMGLGWCRRNDSVRTGLAGGPGFPKPIAEYLADKYAYRTEEAELYGKRVIDIITMLADKLRAQKSAGSRFYVGSSLTALDIYSATFVGLLSPLPPEHVQLPDALRAGFSAMDDATRRAFDPVLVEHRDYVYSEFLSLPLKL
jgi:glutathione S-transferase